MHALAKTLMFSVAAITAAAANAAPFADGPEDSTEIRSEPIAGSITTHGTPISRMCLKRSRNWEATCAVRLTRRTSAMRGKNITTNWSTPTRTM